jgi:catechol 2,3-dioxygenase-like lactoylglutathione lyase family enzyme
MHNKPLGILCVLPAGNKTHTQTMASTADNQASSPTSHPTVTLDHATLRTADLAAHRQFFACLLGLQAGFRPDFGFPGDWLYAGDAPLVHLIPAGATGDKDGCGAETIDHVAFAVTDIEAARMRVQAAGYRHAESRIDELGERRLFVESPTGIRIELVERGNGA